MSRDLLPMCADEARLRKFDEAASNATQECSHYLHLESLVA